MAARTSDGSRLYICLAKSNDLTVGASDGLVGTRAGVIAAAPLCAEFPLRRWNPAAAARLRRRFFAGLLPLAARLRQRRRLMAELAEFVFGPRVRILRTRHVVH